MGKKRALPALKGSAPAQGHMDAPRTREDRPNGRKKRQAQPGATAPGGAEKRREERAERAAEPPTARQALRAWRAGKARGRARTHRARCVRSGRASAAMGQDEARPALRPTPPGLGLAYRPPSGGLRRGPNRPPRPRGAIAAPQGTHPLTRPQQRPDCSGADRERGRVPPDAGKMGPKRTQ